MKTATALILACGTCGAGFLAGWQVFHSDGTCKVEMPPEPQAQRVEPLLGPKHVTEVPSELERPDSRLSIAPAPPAPVAPVPVAVKEEPAKPAVTADPSDPRNLPESTLVEMKSKREAIQNYLNERTAPIIHQRLQDGLYDHVSDEPAWKGGDSEWERTAIYGLASGPNLPGWNRTILPRNQYPELYAFKDETIRLDKLIHDRVFAEAAQASTAPR